MNEILDKSKASSQIPSVEKKHEIHHAFFDIDGTILNLEGRYTERLVRAIEALQNQGVSTSVSSGRPAFACESIINELQLRNVGVFCTGAHVFDPQNGQTLAQHYLDKSLALELLQILRDSDLYYELYTNKEFFIEHNRATEIREVHQHHLRVDASYADCEQLIQNDVPVLKFLVGSDQINPRHKIEALEKRFDSLIFAYAGLPAYPQWAFASIVSDKANKTHAFDEALKQLGVDAKHVASFGDSQSDMIFIEKSGLGVAMGNASKEVQAIANYVAKPVWEDGLADAIEKLILY